LFLLTLASLTAGAQATQGSVIGTVKDSKGAVVPNASVTLINLDEGVSRTTKTSSTGTYAFLDSKAARYTLRVEAPGFEVSETAGVTLQVRQELRLDATLSVGSVQQSVTVNGDSVSAIQTDSPTISATFTQDDANSLPVNTRASFSGTSAAGILSTLPGAQGDSSGVSLQGALPYQVDVTVDGITLKNAGGGTFIGDSFPSTEAISEIRTDSVMANAEYGDPGQVIVTTKGGSNLFHGSAFTYYQDSKWNAIAYTYPITTSQPPVHGATFGGSLGGPVVFPHLYNGHNKSFFFVDYEGWRHPAKTLLQEVVPSTLMKQGDFSKYVVPDGKGGNAFTGLTDPYTQTSWGTAVPSGNINTIAMNTLSQFYPDPNIGDPTAYTDNGVANWEQQVDISAHSNQFDVRGDQYFGANQKFLIWGKFTYKNFPGLSTKPLLVPSEQNLNNNKVLRVDTNWTIAPSLINEGGFGFTRVNNGSTNSFDGNAWTVSQGWQGLQNLFYNGIPEMDFNHIQSLDADRLTSVGNSLTYVYNDTLLWSKKNHTFKFGIDIQTLEAASALGFNGSDNYGTYNFTNGSASTGGFTGVDFADFLTGIPDATFYDVVKQDNDGVSAHYHVFAQDDWRVTPNLTISYGVRYELHPGYHDKGGDIGNFDPTVAGSGRAIYPDGKSALLAQAFLASANACDPDGVNNTNNATVNGAACMPVETASQAGFPTGLKKYPHLRFMPRIGLAYRPFHNDRTALRAGYGIYNINMLGSSFYSLTGTLQAQTQQFNNGLNCGDSGCTPYWQWPTVYSGTGSAAGVGGYGTAYFGTANSINWKDPYTEQWSASIDRDLGKGYALRLSYIGSETHDLVWAPDENTLPYSSTVSAYDQPQSARLFPNWGRINTRDTGANQSYNSMQIDATHRMQHGLEYHSTFTWAKSLADNEGPANTGFAGEGGGSRATSILNRHVDFGNVYGTRRIRWNTTALYDLPFGRGKMFGGSMPRVADLIVGGWRLSSILTVQTGPYLMPYFPSGQGDPSGTGSGLTSSAAGWDPGHRNQAPDRVAGVSNKPRGQNRFNWTNAAAYTCPGDPNWFAGNACVTGNSGNTVTYEDKKYVGYEVLNGVLYKVPNPIGRFGNSGVGTVEGPGLVNLSSGLSKSFAITEHMHLKAEGTFTNVLNHTNLGDPNMDLSSASFGLITGTIGSDFGGARTAQIAARLEF
jgi:hypothetical protein